VSPKHKSAAGPPPQPPKRTASLLSEEITPPREELPASPPSRMVLYDDLLKDEDYSGELRPDVEAALTKENNRSPPHFYFNHFIRELNFSIPDPGSKKIPDPGSGSASKVF
jgi:hypothetical protein